MKKISKAAIDQELIVIASDLLAESGVPYKKEIKMDASLQRHLGIDSLGRAELFQRIEKKFDVSVPDRLLSEAETLNDIATFLESAGPRIKRPTQHEVVVSHGETSHVDPSQAKTLLDVLHLYAERSPDKAHTYFQNEDGKEEIITYSQLLKNSLRVAHGLHDRGLKEGETVAIMQPTHPGFFYTFFGTLLAGGVPVPIYPPFRMHMLEAYAKTEARILRNAEVRILVTFEQAEKLSHLLQAFVPSLKHVTTVHELLKPQEFKHSFRAKSDHFAFIQYTSGSTSDPKGVLLSHDNLLANIRAYGKAIQITTEDVAVSWLPLYHDMGLIGMWLGSLYFGIPLILLTPFAFLNHPERWLWAIHHHRGTLIGAPNFAYELCVRKIDPVLIEGLDLSSLRMAANGAEKIYPRTLEQFAKKFAPYGFNRNALLPVYGLAESTVGLAIPPIGREFLVDEVDRKKFEEDRQAIQTEEKNRNRNKAKNKNTLSFVSCGVPIEGHEIRIVDDENHELPERHVGNLQFRGPSSMQGYYNNPRATQAVYHAGWLDSGDLAYQANGEVYITGRRKDLIIKAGRNIYPAEIEELVGNILGVRQGCVVAFGASDDKRGTEQLIVVAETREKNKAKREEISANINETIATALDILPDYIALTAPHTIPKTSSGKLQRAACKALYLEGRLGKMHVPAWMQVAKLSAQWFIRKTMMGFSQFGKFIYTAYVVLIVSITLLPLWIVMYVASREVAAKAVRMWAKCLQIAVFCPVKVVGLENLTTASPIIYAVNHASYIDTIVMLALVPSNTRFVSKKELFSVPIIRTFLQKLDYLAVDRIDLPKGIEDTRHIENALKRRSPILIFPEGTFSYASGLRPFRLGAFKIATETNTPVCPIALQGTRSILRDDEKLMRPGRVMVTISEPIAPKGSEWQDVIELRSAVRAEIAKYCGEPSLDFIVAQTVAPKPPRSR
jgi:fatty-acyl-CoA synthase